MLLASIPRTHAHRGILSAAKLPTAHTNTVPAALGAVKMKLRARAVRSTVRSASAWQGPVVLAKWPWNADPADSHVTLRFCILVYCVHVKI